MRLRVKEEKCSECKTRECLENCPNRLEFNSLNCRHCNPETAPCALACPKNAFFESAEGILSINEEKCNGCGKCAEACEFNAITLRDGKASKCDLCAGNGFRPACVESCPNGSLKAEWTREELKAKESALGCAVFTPGNGRKRVLSERENHCIIEASNGEKWYLVKEFPELSGQEALLVREILEEFQSMPENSEKNIAGAMERVLETRMVELDQQQREYFLGILFSLVHGFGPVSLLLEDDSLEEIALIGVGRERPLRVYHHAFGWCKCNVYFADQKSVANMVNRMLLKTERRLSLSTPRVNGVLPNGSRLNATIPPVSFTQPSFTIRKFNSKKFTIQELVRNKTVSAETTAFLSMALEADCSVLIAGNTGSGKTTTLNALFSFVPKSDRVVVVEETPELQLEHDHVVRLNTCPRRGIGMPELIVDSLRMRPDRVVVGEIRNREEVTAFIDTLLAGQGKGSYATFHSTSSLEAVKRLSLLGVKEIDLCSLDLVVVQKRWDRIDLGKGTRREMRRVTEVSEVLEKNSRLAVNTLYSYNYSREKLEPKAKSKKASRKIQRAFSFSEKAFRKELARRKRLVERGKSLCA